VSKDLSFLLERAIACAVSWTNLYYIEYVTVLTIVLNTNSSTLETIEASNNICFLAFDAFISLELATSCGAFSILSYAVDLLGIISYRRYSVFCLASMLSFASCG
jgi:hypothetical protein